MANSNRKMPMKSIMTQPPKCKRDKSKEKNKIADKNQGSPKKKYISRHNARK